MNVLMLERLARVKPMISTSSLLGPGAKVERS